MQQGASLVGLVLREIDEADAVELLLLRLVGGDDLQRVPLDDGEFGERAVRRPFRRGALRKGAELDAPALSLCEILSRKSRQSVTIFGCKWSSGRADNDVAAQSNRTQLPGCLSLVGGGPFDAL
jgi:hypothetical protein